MSGRCLIAAAIIMAGLVAGSGCNRGADMQTDGDGAAAGVAKQKSVGPESEAGDSQTANDWSENKSLTPYRRSWAVIIGIDAYQGGDSGFAPLSYAYNDARSFRDFLCTEFGYRHENIRFLADEEATQMAIRQAFEIWLPEQDLLPDDSILVFFAGHGTLAGELGAADSVEADSTTCTSIAWMKERLAALRPRHKLIVLDSCYSGTLFEKQSATNVQTIPRSTNGSTGKSDPQSTGTESDTLQYFLSRPAFVGLSAGRIAPVADGQGDDRHSLFTSVLLDVMRERAGSNRRDHAFTALSLASLVEARVASRPGSVQVPNWGRITTGMGGFVFRPIRRRTTPAEQSASDATRIKKTEYFAAIQEAYRLSLSGQFQQCTEILNEIRNDVPQKWRSFEWGYLRRLAEENTTVESVIRVERRCDPSYTMFGHVAFSPDGRFLVATTLDQLTDDGTHEIAYVWDVATGRQIVRLTGGEKDFSIVAFSPSGKLFVAIDASGGRTRRVQIWETKTWRKVEDFSGALEDFEYENPEITELVLQLNKPVRSKAIWNPKSKRYDWDPEPKLSPDGQRKVWMNGAFIVLTDVETDEEILRIDHSPGVGVTHLLFSPDGTALVTATNSGTVHIYRGLNQNSAVESEILSHD